MPEYKFLIPVVRDGSKEPHEQNRWWVLEEMLSDIGGGFTDEGEVQGQWRDPAGKIIKDRSRKFVIGLPEDKKDDLCWVLAFVCKLFDQQEIYLADNAGSYEFVKTRPMGIEDFRRVSDRARRAANPGYIPT